jgi:2,4-dienoyl-CoA reductase-like NADH-dependent reductase (Old Yellow Enzyme family)
VEDGWNPDETVELARRLKSLGVDLVDVSSGGTSPNAEIPVGPGYQTRFAERVRQEAGVATGTVGMITEAAQAEHILRTGQADLILLARELLRDPYWPLHAADFLEDRSVPWPAQYLRATHPGTPARQVPDSD